MCKNLRVRHPQAGYQKFSACPVFRNLHNFHSNPPCFQPSFCYGYVSRFSEQALHKNDCQQTYANKFSVRFAQCNISIRHFMLHTCNGNKVGFVCLTHTFKAGCISRSTRHALLEKRVLLLSHRWNL